MMVLGGGAMGRGESITIALSSVSECFVVEGPEQVHFSLCLSVSMSPPTPRLSFSFS